MQITEHFALEELTASDAAARLGIDNAPPPPVVENLHVLAEGLERVRDILAHPMHILSGYRCLALNTAVRGAVDSQHLVGLAADFICPQFGTPLEVCRRIEQSHIAFDQLIQEGTWVHISFSEHPRNQVLTAAFGPHGTTYSEGLT